MDQRHIPNIINKYSAGEERPWIEPQAKFYTILIGPFSRYSLNEEEEANAPPRMMPSAKLLTSQILRHEGITRI